MRLLLLFILFTFSSASVFAEGTPAVANFTFLEKLTYQGVSGYNEWLEFKGDDGRKVNGFHYDVLVKPDEYGSWQEQEELDIVLSPDMGLGLLRKKDKTFYKVIFEDAPKIFYNVQSKCEGGSGASRVIAACAYEQVERWQLEQDAVLNFLYTVKSKEEAELIKAGQDSWETYTKVQEEAYVRSLQDAVGSKYLYYLPVMLAKLERQRLEIIKSFFDS